MTRKLNEASTLTLKGSPDEITKQLQDAYADGKISAKTMNAALSRLHSTNAKSLKMNVTSHQGTDPDVETRATAPEGAHTRSDMAPDENGGSASEGSFDNNTQSRTVTQGQDSQVSPTDWDADRPVDVQEPNADGGASGDTGGGDAGGGDAGDVGGGDIGAGDVPAAGGADGGGAGLAWFATHFKEIAIVAGAAAVLAGIIALIKTASKSIKVRYNKCVKTLQRAQKDFTLKPDGLNMKSILPGVGSKINDWLSRLFTWNWKAGKDTKGNIGLHPFCNRYKEEIAYDYNMAKTAYSKIRATVDSETGEINSSVDVTYKSFREAIVSGNLYEGYNPEMNESVIMGILGSVAASTLLRGIKAGAGVFKAPKIDKDGKIIKGESVGVQVTKESTREICYAIINNFAEKYINMEAVYKKLGIDTKSLSDLDTSACDKLAQMIEAYSKPEPNAYTKQYSRIKSAYDRMLKHYFAIGDGIIDNFKKYTTADDEKHANLLVASFEKLKNMWDTQKDIYNNNFSHVVVEIISCDAYLNYVNFIINDVIPVFKSGLAGDADYVLDVNPKAHEYYVVKQTGNKDALGGNGAPVVPEGKSVLVEVIGYNREEKKISFRLIGAIEGDYTIDDSGMCDISGCTIDYKAYREEGKPAEVTIDAPKWIALDPTPTEWSAEIYTHLYTRKKKMSDKEYIQEVYGVRRADQETEGFTKVVYFTVHPAYYDVMAVTYITSKSAIEEDGLNQIFIDAGFNDTNNTAIDFVKGCKNSNEVELDNGEAVKEYLKDHDPGLAAPAKSSDLYKKEDGEQDIYIYADADMDLESENADTTTKLNEEDDDTIDPNDAGADNKNISKCLVGAVKKGSDVAKGDPATMDFNGAYIKLKPCSIKEFDTQMKQLGFSVIKDDAKVIKKNIHGAIISQKGYVKQVTVDGEYDINSIEKPVKEIVERLDYMDKIKLDADRIADEIFNKVNSVKKQATPYTLGGSDNILKNFVVDGQNTCVHMFNEIKYNCNVKRDGSTVNANITINGFLKEGKTDAEKLALLLYFSDLNKQNTTYYCTATMSKDSIKNAVIALINMAKTSKQLEADKMPVKKFAPSSANTDNPNTKGGLDGCISEFISLINIDGKTGTATLKDPKNNKTQNVEITSDKNKAGVMLVVFKDNGKPVFSFHVEPGGNGDVDVYGDDANNRYGAKSNDELIANIKNLYNDFKTKKNNNGEKGNSVQPSQGSEQGSQSQGAQNNTQGQQRVQGNSKENQGGQESKSPAGTESVTYKFENQMSESVYSTVSVSRHIDGKFKNCYILSEALYKDYDSDGVSKLDESTFVSGLKSKEDCIKFAKQHMNAHFMKFAKDTKYNVVSEKKYTPSDQTPLYESCVVVEFNDNDRIVRKVNLGKNKIS